MDVDYGAIFAMFQAEAGENLATMETSLVGLEHAPDDAERLNTLFRMAHTLKGNAASLELRPVAELAHALEDLLELVRGGRRSITRELIDLLLESVDALRSSLAELEGPSEAGAPAELVARLRAAAAKGERPSAKQSAAAADASAGAAPLPTPDAELRTQRVAVRKLDRLLDLASEIAIDRGRLRQGLGEQAAALLADSEHLY